MSTEAHRNVSLSDAERRELAGQLSLKTTSGVSRGFCTPGESPSDGAVVARIPDSMEGAAMSVCGAKGRVVEEGVKFYRRDGSPGENVSCRKVSCRWIQDSPVHVHGQTQELYVILEGEGRMVFGEKVADVTAGSIVLIPPRVEHGLMSTTDKPVKALLVFTPGLAPPEKPEFRDEEIVHMRTSDRVRELQK